MTMLILCNINLTIWRCKDITSDNQIISYLSKGRESWNRRKAENGHVVVNGLNVNAARAAEILDVTFDRHAIERVSWDRANE